MGELGRFILYFGDEEDGAKPSGEGAIVDQAIVDSAVLSE